MSGRRAPHLQRRNGIYHLRMRVPDAIRPLLDRTEVRRTLGTSSFLKARSQAAYYSAKVMEAFRVITTYTLSKGEARKLVLSCFADLVAATEATPISLNKSDRPDLDRIEQLGLSQERITDLNGQLLATTFDHSVAVASKELVESNQLDWEAMTAACKDDLMSGVARALLEQQWLFQLRVSDRLIGFVPKDELFLAPIANPPPHFRPHERTEMGATVEHAVRDYLESGRKQWVRKTHQARTWQLDFFCQHVGAVLPLSAVTVDHVRSFRDAVRSLHRRHGRMKCVGFAQRQTPNLAHRITDKTASIIFDALKAFLRWAAFVDGRINSNPAENVRIPVAKKLKGQKNRRPFSTAELEKLFKAPIFTGCQSVHRRYEPGPHIIKDGKFWLPVLGLYTGARLGELVQLHITDVRLDQEIPVISFSETRPGEADAPNRKHLKTEASVRTVPLHPDIMELGFADFVKGRKRKAGNSQVRLFNEFQYGSDGQASTVASKWFARFMDSVGLTDTALVFHSFRHTAEDALRDSREPQYIIDKLLGHSDSAASAGYGDGASLEVHYEAIKSMKLKVRLPDLLREADV